VEEGSKPEGWSRRLGSRETLTLVLILVVAAALRLYGLNWDGGHWLHPDERQIYFVVLRLHWPGSLAVALSPSSPLNPHFFAYGSLPIYLLKGVVALLQPLWPALRDTDNLHLAGRPLAVLFDLGTVYLTYRLARRLWRPLAKPAAVPSAGDDPQPGRGHWPALLAAAFVALAVLHLQLAHFYTADTPLAFFVLLSLYFAAAVARPGSGRRQEIALGVALGLALATKVSAAPLLFVLPVAYDIRARAAHPGSGASPTGLARLTGILRPMLLPLLVAAAVFFLTQPYALIDWRNYLDQTLRESQIARGDLDVPYTLQYAGTLPLLYTLWQTALWALPLPLGLVAWASLAASLLRWLRHGSWADALLLAWVGPTLVITGLQYTKYLRYMLPVLPVLCILTAALLAGLIHKHRTARKSSAAHPPSSIFHLPSAPIRRLSSIALVLLLLASLAYALAFVSLYAAPHSWISASDWIYRNLPAGSTLAVEHWDTALPLIVTVDGVGHGPTDYAYRTLNLYDEPDDAAKWQTLAADLSASDLLVVASRRLYGSIPRLPERYPVASRYYDLLFAGELGFELVGEFTRGPSWLNPRLPPLPGAAPGLLHPDESFVVYDHPRALILRNVERLPAPELLQRLGID
jgi:4-amino-4-deoxy-L-arabinose transferase-like glycosyltransferase